MKIVHIQTIVKRGRFATSHEVSKIQEQIRQAIKEISWPIGKRGFYLNPTSRGKGRGEGNGVKPIKEACVTYLKGLGWKDELRLRPKGIAGTGPLDIVKETPFGLFGLEWETGNISSSSDNLK